MYDGSAIGWAWFQRRWAERRRAYAVGWLEKQKVLRRATLAALRETF